LELQRFEIQRLKQQEEYELAKRREQRKQDNAAVQLVGKYDYPVKEFLKTKNVYRFTGIYIIFNVTLKKCYVGQAKKS
jgi:hypothetical protein